MVRGGVTRNARLWLAALALVLAALAAAACGGESRRVEPSQADATAPTASTPAPTPSNPAACPAPPLDVDAGAPNPHGCAPHLVNLDPGVHDSCSYDGITVEPLQLPTAIAPIGPSQEPVPAEEPDPSTWDTSDLPAGACVFRLHGVNQACYWLGSKLFAGHCADFTAESEQAVSSFFSGYNYCTGGPPAPGCPSADPDSQGDGSWWYSIDRGSDVTDVVICAPGCWHALAESGGCLQLLSREPNTCR